MTILLFIFIYFIIFFSVFDEGDSDSEFHPRMSPITIPKVILNNGEVNCKTCGKLYKPSSEANFLFRDLCVSCQSAFEDSLAALNGSATSSSTRPEQALKEQSVDDVDEEKDPNDVPQGQGQEIDVDINALNQYIDEAVVSENSIKGRENMEEEEDVNNPPIIENSSSSSADSPSVTLEVMLGSILASGLLAGQIFLNNIPYMVEAEKTNIPDGRGAGTTMFHNEYSKKLPELYWYRFYAGFVTKQYQCMGLCMTKCGNVFVGVMETMCSAPRYDPVIYFTKTKSAKIMQSTQWRRQYILDPSAVMTTDIDDVNR